MDLNEDSLHLQHLKHPLVQQSEQDAINEINAMNWTNATNGTNGWDRKGRGGWRGLKGKRGKKNMRMRCQSSFDSAPECLNSYYTRLDENNEVEWELALSNWWWNQVKIAWFGWLFIPLAGFMGFLQLIFPDLKPDIDNAPWRSKDKPLTTKWYSLYTYVTQLSEPNLFFLSQIFTFGESDLRDFSIIYMDNFTAFVYSFINQIDLIASYPYALFHSTLFGPIYLVQLLMWVFKGLFDDDDKNGRSRRGGRGSQGGRSG